MVPDNEQPDAKPDADEPKGKYPAGKHPNSLKALEGHQWAPGTSGNPTGRPKGKSITARIRRLLEKAAEKDGGRDVADAIASVIVAQALKGDYRFVRELMDRTEGKVPDRFAGFDGGPIVDDTQAAINKIMGDPKAMSLAMELANRIQGTEDDDGKR